eukprot:Hpha_TRINITY_DN16071_c3_g6::TRINITY_DN16071_c3_g6_i1::g.121012::m.121012
MLFYVRVGRVFFPVKIEKCFAFAIYSGEKSVSIWFSARERDKKTELRGSPITETPPPKLRSKPPLSSQSLPPPSQNPNTKHETHPTPRNTPLWIIRIGSDIRGSFSPSPLPREFFPLSFLLLFVVCWGGGGGVAVVFPYRGAR